MQVKSEVENDNYLTSNPVSQLPQASHAYSSVSASPDQQRSVINNKLKLFVAFLIFNLITASNAALKISFLHSSIVWLSEGRIFYVLYH